ncbi:MAG: hypothetical protein Q8K92_12920, partial [Leadbetterella sp.]|nr:hypothetical protein [Leadbetterella sp.]
MVKRLIPIQILSSILLFNSFQAAEQHSSPPISTERVLQQKKQEKQALNRIKELNNILPQSKTKTKLKHLKELFGILTETGRATIKNGALSESITSIDLSQFPSICKGSAISPLDSAWEKNDLIEPSTF